MRKVLILIPLFLKLLDASSIPLPKKISAIKYKDSIKKIPSKKQGVCLFKVSQRFGFEPGDIDFVQNLYQNSYEIHQDCKPHFLLPYNIYDFLNNKSTEKNSIVPLHYFLMYHLMYLSSKQFESAAEMLLFKNSKLINKKLSETESAYSAELSEIFFSEALYTLYVNYDDIGTLLSKLPLNDLKKYASKFFLTLEIGNPCEDYNNKFILDTIQLIEKRNIQSYF